MPTKKKAVVMKASLTATDKENIIAFDKVVESIVASKLKNLNGRPGSRRLVKITSGLKVKVDIALADAKVKVTYTINGEVYLDKQYTDLESYKADIAEIEEGL